MLKRPTSRRKGHQKQIELNLVRWRWVPDSLGERYLFVNIPEFMLRVVEHDRTVNAMRVVVTCFPLKSARTAADPGSAT